MTTYLMPYKEFDRLDEVLEGLLDKTDDDHNLVIVRVLTHNADADNEELFTELRGLQARIQPYNCRIEIDRQPALAA